MFAQSTIRERVGSMLARYDFLNADVLGYFDKRLTQAPRDADFALDYVRREARTPNSRRRSSQLSSSNARSCGVSLTVFIMLM